MRTSYCPVVGGLLALALLTWPAVEPAANPISWVVSAVAQVPESHHVQVSWGRATEAGGCGTSSNGDGFALSRDGTRIDAVWLEPVDVTHNTGSGLDTVCLVQVCDCDVPLGEHTYDVTVPEDMRDDGWGNLRVTVKDPPPETPEAWEQPNPDDYENPWDIPSPQWPKGHDCLAWCASPAASTPATDGDVATSAPATDSAVAATDDDVATSVPETNDPLAASAPLTDDDLSGCAAGGGGATSALLLLVLLALGVRRARRRLPSPD